GYGEVVVKLCSFRVERGQRNAAFPSRRRRQARNFRLPALKYAASAERHRKPPDLLAVFPHRVWGFWPERLLRHFSLCVQSLNPQFFFPPESPARCSLPVRVCDIIALKMVKIAALVLFTLSAVAFAEDPKQTSEDDPFTFDYDRLRVGGLILAAVLCLIGITILLSGHCRCKFNQDKRRRAGSSAAAQQMLNDQGRASEC
uniref:FXYD domain-containing ion transport regulator n=2 Tax=Scleropages formosus TaxID=113540 RepID=A0A8C9V7D4_SCLFO